MPASLIDSAVFRDIFSTEAMRRIFSDENPPEISRLRSRTGAGASADRHYSEGSRRGNLPALQCRRDRFRQAQNADRAHRLSGAAGGAAARGALPRRARRMVPLGRDDARHHRQRDCHADPRGADRLEAHLDAITDALAALAKKYRDTPMAGRSNLQQAVPITFGYKMATVLAGFERHKERLREVRKRVLVGEFGGAAGTLSSLGGRGLETQAELMKELKLGQPAIAWHTVRDTIAEAGCFLGLVTGSCGKIAFDVKLLMQTEVEELYEPFHEGRGSSSTMPQKRNPISSVYITALTSVVRQQVGALLDAMVEDHERATGPWEIEWIVLPEIFCYTAAALAQTEFVLTGLQVDEKKMRSKSRPDQGPDRVGGGDDGARPLSGPPICPRPRLRHLPQSGPQPAGRCSICWRRTRKSPSTSTARPWRSSATRRIIWARPARWWIGCWRCGGNSPSAAPLPLVGRGGGREVRVSSVDALHVTSRSPTCPPPQRGRKDHSAAAALAAACSRTNLSIAN